MGWVSEKHHKMHVFHLHCHQRISAFVKCREPSMQSLSTFENKQFVYQLLVHIIGEVIPGPHPSRC